jgi:hypothetical protein
MRIKFYDAQSMGVAIYGPAVGFSLLAGFFFKEKFGVIVAIFAILTVLIFFLNLRRRTLLSMRLESDSIELVTLGERYAFRIGEIRSCCICGIYAAFTFILFIRIAGRWLPVFFQAGAFSTSVGGYRESVQQAKLMLQYVRKQERRRVE